jgi:hypothetical protein
VQDTTKFVHTEIRGPELKNLAQSLWDRAFHDAQAGEIYAYLPNPNHYVADKALIKALGNASNPFDPQLTDVGHTALRLQITNAAGAQNIRLFAPPIHECFKARLTYLDIKEADTLFALRTITDQNLSNKLVWIWKFFHGHEGLPRFDQTNYNSLVLQDSVAVQNNNVANQRYLAGEV